MTDATPGPGNADDPGEDWVVLSHPASLARLGHVPSTRAVVGRMVAAAAVVSLIIGTIAFFVSNRLAEQDTLSEGIRITQILASEITPQLSERLFAGDIAATQVVDEGLLPALSRYGVRRLKLFDTSGKVLYSDEHRLIGKTFELADIESVAFAAGEPEAEVSTADGAENEYERVPGQLIEVRQPLTGWNGQRALLEVYLDYAIVGERANQLWRAFLVLLIGSLVLLTGMVIPVAFQLLRRISEGTRQREELLQRAVEASDLERRRIAGSLHDGPVQELVGNTLVLSATADKLVGDGQPAAAANVSRAAAAVRGTVGSLRSLLVDLYPASIDDLGLRGALDDLVTSLRSRGLAVTLQVDDSEVGPADRRLAYRVAQECLRNVAKHAGATAVAVRVSSDAAGWGLSIIDNGHGFDVGAAGAASASGHFGIRIMSDLASEAGATLRVASGPAGTRWELRKGNG